MGDSFSGVQTPVEPRQGRPGASPALHLPSLPASVSTALNNKITASRPRSSEAGGAAQDRKAREPHGLQLHPDCFLAGLPMAHF